jgi:hypothetical protein
MKETKINVIKQFKVKRNYIVYLIEEKDSYDFYMRCKNYAVIELLFGLPKKQQSLEEAIEICKQNIDEYIRVYNDTWM